MNTFFKLLTLILTASLQATDTNNDIVNAIINQNATELKQLITTAKLTAQQKRAVVQFAADRAAEYEAASTLSGQTKKSIFATACVVFFASIGFFIKDPLLVSVLSDNLSRDLPPVLPHICAGIFCAGAAIASGYECDTGYYTNKPVYIRDFLSTKLKCGYYSDGVYYTRMQTHN